MYRISWVVERLLAHHEELCSTELGIIHFRIFQNVSVITEIDINVVYVEIRS
jgi:hypothetical protein